MIEPTIGLVDLIYTLSTRAIGIIVHHFSASDPQLIRQKYYERIKDKKIVPLKRKTETIDEKQETPATKQDLKETGPAKKLDNLGN